MLELVSSIELLRKRRAAKEGSPEILHELTIAANDFEIVDYEQHDVAKRYLPLNEVVFINTGSVEVKVYYNQRNDDYETIPAGSILKEDTKWIRSLKVVNEDAENQATIKIKAKKRPATIDDVVRKLIP